MPQGKIKIKTKLPQNAKNKKPVKGSAVTKRANRPIKPKKTKNEQSRKLKEIMTKTVNKTMEDEIRSKATNDNQNLSKAQLAVAQHHLKIKSSK